MLDAFEFFRFTEPTPFCLLRQVVWLSSVVGLKTLRIFSFGQHNAGTLGLVDGGGSWRFEDGFCLIVKSELGR